MRDHLVSMPASRSSDVLTSLPRTRPHRRSQKRPARAAAAAPAQDTPAAKPVRAAAAKPARTATKPTGTAPAGKTARAAAAKGPTSVESARQARSAPKAKPARLRQPAQPGGTPPGPRRAPTPPNKPTWSRTAVQAAAELAEIGLSAGARTIRGVVSRLPRPLSVQRYVYFRAVQPSDRPSAGDRRGNHLRASVFAGANRSRPGP